MNLHMQKPPQRDESWGGSKLDQLGGVIEAEDEAEASSRQAPSAALAAADVTIAEINERIRAANDAISRAADFVREANKAIAEANALIERKMVIRRYWGRRAIIAIDEPDAIVEIEDDESQ